MRKRILLLINFLAVCSFLRAQEDCYTYFPNTIGNEWSYKSYDKRGRLTHGTLHTLKVLRASAARVSTISFNEEGEPLGLKDKDGDIEAMESGFDLVCAEGSLYTPPKSFTSSFFSLLQGLDVEVAGNKVLVNYADMAESTNLPDYSLRIKIDAVSLKIDINVTDRKIIDRETIETPVGTFDCFVLQHKTIRALAS